MKKLVLIAILLALFLQETKAQYGKDLLMHSALKG